MPKASEFKSSAEVRDFFIEVGKGIRAGKPNLGRTNYSLNLALGVWQAIVCGYDRITAVEIGVARGDGLLDLCKAAEYFHDLVGIQIDVVGFDNATGLPLTQGYKDHPELWDRGQFKMESADELRAKLPSFAKLVIGDVRDTIKGLETEMGESRLGFVSVDVDYYSSTVPALDIFTFDQSKYLPAVPVYFDDVHKLITYNRWCSEEAAINEFNYANAMRKLQRHEMMKVYVAHVLDHPIRTGDQKLRPRFTLHVFPI